MKGFLRSVKQNSDVKAHRENDEELSAPAKREEGPSAARAASGGWWRGLLSWSFVVITESNKVKSSTDDLQRLRRVAARAPSTILLRRISPLPRCTRGRMKRRIARTKPHWPHPALRREGTRCQTGKRVQRGDYGDRFGFGPSRLDSGASAAARSRTRARIAPPPQQIGQENEAAADHERSAMVSLSRIASGAASAASTMASPSASPASGPADACGPKPGRWRASTACGCRS